jgi:hypothetical protein
MHKSATKCNKTIGKWCKNKHGASKIIYTFETYQSRRPRVLGKIIEAAGYNCYGTSWKIFYLSRTVSSLGGHLSALRSKITQLEDGDLYMTKILGISSRLTHHVRTRPIWSNRTGTPVAHASAVRRIRPNASGSTHQSTKFGLPMRRRGQARYSCVSSRVGLGLIWQRLNRQE